MPPSGIKESTLDDKDQLLVLGNGFDLQCGLKSAFADFMETRRTLIAEANGEWDPNRIPSLEGPEGPNGKLPDGNRFAYLLWNKGLTAWDFVLGEDEQERTWYDIEECIRTWVDYGTARGGSPCDEHMRRILFMQRGAYPTIPRPTTSEIAVHHFAQDLYQLGLTGWGPDSILSVLMDELHRFEREFAEYLKEQQGECTEYSNKAVGLLSNLVTDEAQPDTPAYLLTEFPGPVSVLNFNYTYPSALFGDIAPSMLSVHGLAIDGNIIFGMDGKNLDPSQPYYASTVKFSKTYRLMDLSSRPHQPLVRPYVPGSPDSATQIIKFYGHSLGDADYSYFQAIFDEVNLYESNTRLIFYYNKNRPNTTLQEKAAQEEMFGKVNRLITAYGTTLDNEDHGRNLLHKLLLEGRLTIKQAPIER